MNSKIKYFFGSLLVVVILVWVAIFAIAEQNNLRVYFFDVGQGDATLVSLGSNQILIDGGPSGQILDRLGRVMPFFDKKIEIVISTHPDADHISGLVDVFKNYQVDEYLSTGVISDTNVFQALSQAIEEKQIPQVIAHVGQKIQITPAINLELLYPFTDLSGKKLSNTNSSSIVAKLNAGGESILLTGDAEESVERELMSANLNLKANVLKVAHHGSKSSTSENFVKIVDPKTAIIQVGANNRYGHPTAETLARLVSANILRTDLNGNIELIYENNHFQIKTDR
ncbi:MAG: hypothetical protein COU81_02425 [Candidatus Portnoybacteria bacterium CG10_big_fil_rev_8_21_14_0_10_36_7]|uniref:Metallo-beta-lactamase domain-containing protein n=1 Tax=Candidatus Portnoybacteria bacterium CG10_big_fil_rev_8_21_14_0_10_36_7 TaxID=1974812 RepID=A0A2M8KDZ1_9BACT|nr:MAG: hypothetical protein COU81_02425 [Candidatus Portnoybacteria bacterium CG10_big_fil_rev_8_21_14_0_10_36_7]